jgi:hypothetical protein
LIMYCFMSSLRIFHFYRHSTIACEGLQNLGLCSALRAGRIFICDTGPQFFWSHLKDCLI